ncbi:MAG TPA: ubiquinone/menaquinone biosynthesis methyltransferase [Gemmatimonadaceae bacterium]|nr:ubiquinone/menaquinone biosynthesis methyltransferase [Gemmatimonadaceae bacterium]
MPAINVRVNLYPMATVNDDEAAVDAASGGAGKSAYVREVFSTIAPRYDFLNHLLSMNIDRRWRRNAISELSVERNESGWYLDLCAGTLDISTMLARNAGFRGSVLAADFAEPMLRAGAHKIGPSRIAPVAADALQLPIADASVAGAISAFGIRNIADLDAALREVFRILEPGARFVILEFSVPRSRALNGLYGFYFNRVLPVVGGVVSGHRTAYRYLPRSVEAFPNRDNLARRMTSAGFTDVRWRELSFGIAAIHTGQRAC